ncbi:hypothetical protein KCU81_g126, partial [Aureobasidium melanogenum]
LDGLLALVGVLRHQTSAKLVRLALARHRQCVAEPVYRHPVVVFVYPSSCQYVSLGPGDNEMKVVDAPYRCPPKFLTSIMPSNLPNLRRLFVEARTEAEESAYSRNAFYNLVLFISSVAAFSIVAQRSTAQR